MTVVVGRENWSCVQPQKAAHQQYDLCYILIRNKLVDYPRMKSMPICLFQYVKERVFVFLCRLFSDKFLLIFDSLIAHLLAVVVVAGFRDRLARAVD